jgi:non-heme chloroperoxidase
LASDLDILMTELRLENAILVGFSMGGVEVAKYLSVYGAARTQKAVFISSVTPFLVKSESNPEGVENSVFKNMKKKLMADRPQFLTQFFKDFFNVGYFDKVSEEALHASWIHGIMASPIASLRSVDTWLTDLRVDLKRIRIPTLVIHGDMDKTVPVKASGSRMSEFLENCEYQQLISAPHGLIWTHAEELNAMLLKFIEDSADKNAGKTVRTSSQSKKIGMDEYSKSH